MVESLGLTRSLYIRGYNREQVVELFYFIGWMIRLPEMLEYRLIEAVKRVEEEFKMPYINTVERYGIKQGMLKGLEQGREHGLEQGRIATARTMLSSLTPQEIVEAIAQNDLNVLKSAKGIGVKTAQRMVLDLKDKVLKIYDLEEVSTDSNNTNREEALSALETLGFTRKQADKVCKQIAKENPDASAETIIKLALKKL